MMNLDTILRDPLSRRQFLTRMSAAGLGTAAAALIAGCGGSSNGVAVGPGGTTGTGTGTGGGGTTPVGSSVFPGIPGTGDVQVLNYALSLETAESDLFRQGLNLAANLPITTPLSPNGPSSYGTTFSGNPGQLSSAKANIGFQYLAQYAYDEAAHRDFLLVALGHQADPPGQPTTANTTNPVLDPKGYRFPVASSALSDILALLRIVEETGATAYLGAVPYISSLSNAQAAASIFSTETRHAAGLAYALSVDVGPSGVAGGVQPKPGAVNEFEYAQAPATVLKIVTSKFFN